MKRYFNQSYQYLVLAAFLLLGARATWAGDDGPPDSNQGSFGVNRRIESADGYGAIRGTFSEPSIPSGKAGDDLMGNNNRTQTDVSLPNPYLGAGSSNVRIDAGLKYECRSQYVGNNRPAGWTTFLQYAVRVPDRADPSGFRWIPDPKNGLDSNGKEIRIAKGLLGSCFLNYYVSSDGTANSDVYQGNSSNPLSHTTYPQAFSVDANTAANMFVKSVTSITQTGQCKLTGAYMDGCNFNLSSLSKVSIKDGKFSLTDLPYDNNGFPIVSDQDWGYALVGTGYSPTNYDGTTDVRGNHHKLVVDFSFPSYAKRNANGADPLAINNHRYMNETVDLSLRKGNGNPRGRRTKLGRRVDAGHA